MTDNVFTVEGVLEDLAMSLPAGMMECDIPEYEFEMDENDRLIMNDGKFNITAPSGQKFVVSVQEIK